MHKTMQPIALHITVKHVLEHLLTIIIYAELEEVGWPFIRNNGHLK